MSRHRPPFSEPLRRILASACAGLVLALTLFAASPTAHAWLHTGQKHHTCAEHPESTPAPTTSDHTCAVVLFASGVDSPVEPLALCPPVGLPEGVCRVTATEFFLVSPRFLRQPERGPPLRWVG